MSEIINSAFFDAQNPWGLSLEEHLLGGFDPGNGGVDKCANVRDDPKWIPGGFDGFLARVIEAAGGMCKVSEFGMSEACLEFFKDWSPRFRAWEPGLGLSGTWLRGKIAVQVNKALSGVACHGYDFEGKKLFELTIANAPGKTLNIWQPYLPVYKSPVHSKKSVDARNATKEPSPEELS